MLSERHQMFQAYLSAGPECSQLLQVKGSCTFYPSLYSDAIKHAMREFGFSEHNTSVSTDTDIQYIKQVHHIKRDIILVQNDAAVYFVVDVHKADYHSEYHLYSKVTKQSTRLQCLNLNDLVDFYPLPSYIVDGHQVIPVKHSVLSR